MTDLEWVDSLKRREGETAGAWLGRLTGLDVRDVSLHRMRGRVFYMGMAEKAVEEERFASRLYRKTEALPVRLS